MIELCSICGRPPHAIDDPLCCHPTSGPAGQVAVLKLRVEAAERALVEANTNWANLIQFQQERADAAEAKLRKFGIPTADDMTEANTSPITAQFTNTP